MIVCTQIMIALAFSYKNAASLSAENATINGTLMARGPLNLQELRVPEREIVCAFRVYLVKLLFHIRVDIDVIHSVRHFAPTAARAGRAHKLQNKSASKQKQENSQHPPS